MSDKQHIEEHDYILFQHDLMNSADKIEFLEHISGCDYCADHFASLMSDEVLTAPRDLKANLMKAVNRPDIRLAKKTKDTSKSLQLIWYSLKVGMATVCALALLIITMNLSHIVNTSQTPPTVTFVGIKEPSKEEPITATIKNNMDQISNSILNFSNKIIKTEGSNNDQQTK